jgi:hypothetical protein
VRDSTWPFCLGAVQRPAARPDPPTGSWIRAFVCSARRAAQFYGSKVTQARDLTSKLDDDDRAKYGPGFKVLRAAPSAPAQFAAEAVLTAYTLMAAAAGVVDAYTHITGEKWKPYGAAGRRPATVGQPAKPRSPPSGEAVRAESQDRAWLPHSSLPDGPACGRTPPVVKTRPTKKARGARSPCEKFRDWVRSRHPDNSAVDKRFLTVHHEYCPLKDLVA